MVYNAFLSLAIFDWVAIKFRLVWRHTASWRLLEQYLKSGPTFDLKLVGSETWIDLVTI